MSPCIMHCTHSPRDLNSHDNFPTIIISSTPTWLWPSNEQHPRGTPIISHVATPRDPTLHDSRLTSHCPNQRSPTVVPTVEYHCRRLVPLLPPSQPYNVFFRCPLCHRQLYVFRKPHVTRSFNRVVRAPQRKTTAFLCRSLIGPWKGACHRRRWSVRASWFVCKILAPMRISHLDIVPHYCCYKT